MNLSNVICARCSSWMFGLPITALIVALLLPSISASQQGGVDLESIEKDNTYASIVDDLSAGKRSEKKIDACFCCANKQLSFCCNACLEKSRRRVAGDVEENGLTGRQHLFSQPEANLDNDGSEELRMSATERLLGDRVRNLRSSACACCARSSGSSRKCCLWCGA